MECEVSFSGKRYSVFLPNSDTDYIQSRIQETRSPYEADLLSHVVQTMDPKKTFVDVGAHVGNHSLAVHAVLGCNVLAIEPNKALVSALRKSLRINNWSKKFRLIHAAAGLREGKGRLEGGDASNLGAAHFESGEGDIRIHSLDSVVGETPVGVIKIDVEGMELQVLSGAEETIRNNSPFVYVEVASANKFWSVNAWFSQRGYSWAAVFGHTSTHFYRPGALSLSKTDFETVISREYGLLDELDKSNRKYRELSVSINRYREVARGAEARLAGVVEDSGRVLDELRGQVENLTAQVDRLSKELVSASDRNRQQKEQIERLSSESVKLKADLAVAQANYQTLRVSKAFALGNLFEESVKSRRGMIRLIPRLWSEFAKPKFFPGKRPIVTVSLSTSQSHPETRQHFPVSALNPPRTKSNLREKSVEEMVVLGIADAFTFGGIQSELKFYQALPGQFQEQLENLKPDFVFVESAWDGQDGLWNRQISTPSSALQEFIELSRQLGIPTIFWNKEDPVHFSTFLPAAGLFDYVLTTDIDMVPRYRKILGHERVNWLPFAVQPRLYNPVDAGRREDAIIFAGAYYTRYPERAKEIEDFLDQLPAVKKVNVFDRNLHTDDERYRFPQHLRHHIVGTLSPGEVAETTRTYQYALNLNSIKQSQTMFARRVVECLASGNIVISNFARSLTTLLGDLVITADDGMTLASSLNKLEDPIELGLRQLQGIRVAVNRFSYRRQLERLLALIAEGRKAPWEPTIHVLSPVGNDEDVDFALMNFECQEWEHKTLTLLATGDFTPDAQIFSTRESVSVVRGAAAAKSPLLFTVDRNDWIGVMSPNNRYGRHYLSDFMLWREFGDFTGFGKSSVFSLTPEGVTLGNLEESFVTTTSLPTDTSIFAVTQFSPDATVADLTSSPEQENPEGKFLDTDPFSVVRDGSRLEPEESEPLVSKVLDGVSVLLDGIQPERILGDDVMGDIQGDGQASGFAFQADDLFPLFFPKNKKVLQREPDGSLDGASAAIPHRKVKVSVDGDRLIIESTLSDGEHEYLYATTGIQLSGSQAMHDIVNDGEIPVHLSLVGTCAVSGVVRFTDANGNPIQTTVVPANRNETVPIPPGADAFLLGFRCQGPGHTRIEKLSFSHHEETVPRILGKQKVLIVSGAYPAYGNLYRHAFIHTRNKGYRAQGLDTDVFRLSNSPFTFSEFEGVPVIDGSLEDLNKVISSGAYSHIAVHLMTPEMWQMLQHVVEQTPVTVWLHGAEIEPYWRRPEIDPTPDRVDASNRKMEFWREIFANFPEKLHLVFVSNTFAKQVFEDYGVTLGKNQYSVIPNPIDTDLFNYVPKDTGQRYKVLSIRPYASRKYANDLSVAAVLELAKSADFEKFEFLFVGDGELWDSTVAPLRRFKNVTLRQGFMTQREIAQLHKDYGIFLCPTRHDTQGVSRDEAMASGLVPISNKVGGVPEFVPEGAGILISENGSESFARWIQKLAKDADLYSLFSAGARAAVVGGRAVDRVCPIEIKLLMNLEKNEP